MRNNHKKLWSLALTGAVTGTTMMAVASAAAAGQDHIQCRDMRPGASSQGREGCIYDPYSLLPGTPTDTGLVPGQGPSPAPTPYIS